MSVIAGIGKLRDSAKSLRQQWSEVQGQWHDENARLFYVNQIEPLLARVRAVELAMSQIAATSQKARHECE